jgi:hypothetical protein
MRVYVLENLFSSHAEPAWHENFVTETFSNGDILLENSFVVNNNLRMDSLDPDDEGLVWVYSNPPELSDELLERARRCFD